MTKYYDNKHNTGRRSVEDTPIVIGKAQFTDTAGKTYWCKCNRRLELLNAKTGEYYCRHDNLSVYPEHDPTVRSKSKITTPTNTSNDDNPLVAYPPDPNEEYYKKKEVVLKGGFAALAKKGTIKVTNYVERDGSGKEIR